MIQRITSKLVRHEGQILHSMLESILARLTALEGQLMTLEEGAEGKGSEGLGAKSGVPTSIPASTD